MFAFAEERGISVFHTDPLECYADAVVIAERIRSVMKGKQAN